MKDALALALVHFVWQGALLAIVGAVLMRLTRVPTVRYAIGVATMVAMLVAPVMTFAAIYNADGQSSPSLQPVVTSRNAAAAGDARISSSVRASSPSHSDNLRAVVIPTTWILSAWLAGVIVLSLRFIGGWAVARRLATQALRPVSEELQTLAAQMAARLNVRGAVRVCESASVAVPVMIGWLRPVIVLPPAALAALPLAQLEALLAHELAHIRRHDYLVNLLQTGVETLCFYHPAVWWISREVRRHREHCCDDLAVGVCDRLTYVTALSSLASIATPQFALSAAGGSLRDRVRRLIEPATHSASSKGAWIAMLPILLVISFVAPQAWGVQATTPGTAATVASAAVNVEQARPATAAREAERAQAEAQLELVARERAALREQASTERAKVRELVEAAQARRESSLARQKAEVRRVIEAAKEVHEVPQEAARRRLERTRAALPQIEVAILESKLRAAEAALSRQKELFDKGLATRQSIVASEEELIQLRHQIEQAKLYSVLAETAESRHLEMEKLDKAYQQRLERGLVARRDLSTLDATTTLQAQDRLTISIDGEPDLPTIFTVREDGSIRYPFLGSIRVQGSTTSQVQAAIQKLISDKGLARNPVVTVSASRIR